MQGWARPWVPPAVRIAFGLMWAVDAAFKWVPAFQHNLLTYFSTDGQPAWAADYISWWTGLLGHDPRLCAVALAGLESVLAASLLFGAWTRVACVGGALLSLLIWSTAEGFGGPYGPGSTDVGTSIAYVLVFLLLWWSDAGNLCSIDALRRSHAPFRITPKVGAVAIGLVAFTGLLVAGAVNVASGDVPPSSIDGGQMNMAPGGQDTH